MNEGYRLSFDSNLSLGAVPEPRCAVEVGNVLSKCECRGVWDIILSNVDGLLVAQLDVAYLEC